MLDHVDGDGAGIGSTSHDDDGVVDSMSSFLDRMRSIDPNVVSSAFAYLLNNGKVSMEDADEALRLAGAKNANAHDGMECATRYAPANRTNGSSAMGAGIVEGGRDGGDGVGGRATPSSSSSSSNNNGANGHAIATKARTGSTKSSRRERRRRGSDGTKRTTAPRTRHVALQFSYDGTNYSGFAQNVGVSGDTSVERALFEALERTRLLLTPSEMRGDDDSEGKGNDALTTTDNGSARTLSGYSRCGRTDRGVHAHGQVIALRLRSAFPPNVRLAGEVEGEGGNAVTDVDVDRDPSSSSSSSSPYLEEDDLPKNSIDTLDCLVPTSGSSTTRRTLVEYDYPRMLNGVLPAAIRVLGWCPVTSDFSARFSCRERTYRYFFPRRHLDLDAMACGLRYMMGNNDFRNLCKMNVEQVYNFERVLLRGKVVSPQVVYDVRAPSSEDDDAGDGSGVTRVEISTSSSTKSSSTMSSSPRDMCHVEIVGRAFLWHQIRCIMSVLFYVGRKLELPTLVRDLLDVAKNPAKPSYEMASEAPLVLHRCTYGNSLAFGRTVRNLWDVTKALERRWEDHAISAERARDELDALRAETEVSWADLIDFVERIADGRRGTKRGRWGGGDDMNDGGDVRHELALLRGEEDTLSWGSAVEVIEGALVGAHPHPSSGCSGGHNQRGQTESSVHVPIMERSRGTTYEEKVRSILSSSGGNAGGGMTGDGVRVKSSKRKERYEENIIRKRKTTEEDKAFYDHMLRQGGSSS